MGETLKGGGRRRMGEEKEVGREEEEEGKERGRRTVPAVGAVAATSLLK